MGTPTTSFNLPAIASKLREIAHELSAQFLEREAVIAGMMVAMIAKQHVLLIGNPGTAKSALARAVAARLAGSRHFELLLTKFTTPEEVFGPISLQGLQKDRFTRLIDGRLANAHTAMLDEVGKASSAILNALLALMADRVYHNDGKAISCPLVTVIGATNEIPDGEELSALYDRFLLRYIVESVSDAAFATLLDPQTPAAPASNLDLTELEALQQALPGVTIPANVVHGFVKLRCDLRDQGFMASDRRWRQAIQLLRAYALYQGRETVQDDDLEILSHVLWARPEDQKVLQQAIARLASPLRAKAVELLDRASGIHEEAAKHFSGGETDAIQKAAMTANSKLKGILTELQRLMETNPNQDTTRLDDAYQRIKALNADVVRRGFGL